MATHDVTTTSVSAIVLNERGSQSKITVEIADGDSLDRKGDYIVSRTQGGHKWCSSFSPAEFAELKNLVNRFSLSEDEEIMRNSPRPLHCPCDNDEPDPCPACGATVKGEDVPARGVCQAVNRFSSSEDEEIMRNSPKDI